MGKNTKQVCLSDEDAELFEKAKEKYDMKESTLLARIVSDWLFSIKLQLEKR